LLAFPKKKRSSPSQRLGGKPQVGMQVPYYVTSFFICAAVDPKKRTVRKVTSVSKN
jgi:hypothetical protein